LTNELDVTDTLTAKSDQLNAVDLTGGPMTFRITAIKKVSDTQQPLVLSLDTWKQPYKPCKMMRRVMAELWGKDGNNWVGKSLTLFRDPDVIWSGKKTGGIRIAAMSHIASDMTVTVQSGRGKWETVGIVKIGNESAPAPDLVSRWRPKLSKLSDAAKKVANIIREGWKMHDAEKLQSAETMLADLGADEAEVVGEFLREALEEIST